MNQALADETICPSCGYLNAADAVRCSRWRCGAPIQYRAQVEALESAMLEQTECVDPEELTTHIFCDGIYVRQLRIPKGYTVTGKIHRFRTVNILLQGSIRIALTDGSQVTMTAPHIFISEPGEKKAGFALEDTLWLNVHATEETDLAKLEEQLIVPTYEQLERERREALEDH